MAAVLQTQLIKIHVRTFDVRYKHAKQIKLNREQSLCDLLYFAVVYHNDFVDFVNLWGSLFLCSNVMEAKPNAVKPMTATNDHNKACNI